MSRTLGSKNKPKLEDRDFNPADYPIPDASKLVSGINPLTRGPAPTEIERRKEPRYDLTLSLRVYRRHERWPGQWELTKVDNEGKRTIIVDATSRQSVINMVNRQIMKMVIAG